MEWIGEVEKNSDLATLSTETVDGTIRIWTCFPDEPHYFVLWLTMKTSYDSVLPIANVWIYTDGETKLLSTLENGSVLLHDIQVYTIIESAFQLLSTLTQIFPHMQASRQLLDLCWAILEPPIRTSAFDTSAAINTQVLCNLV